MKRWHWPKHESIVTAQPGVTGFTPTFGLPIWEGQKDCTVLINADCGMGDTIHFYRWLPEGVKFILRCDEELESLFPIETINKEVNIPDVDCVIHMMALPRVLGIETVYGQPYLFPQGRDPFSLMSKSDYRKIGVCWKGNPFNPRDSVRSVSLYDMEDLARHGADAVYYSLVKHERNHKFQDVWFKDWNHTAHFLRHMDLVISVDTAVAHLAGALGVPVWMILPNENVDWRWLDEGEETPWYDSMRIFRSKDWKQLLNNRMTRECDGSTSTS